MPETIRNRALDGLIESGLPWWKRYSPHGEFPWSTAISIAFHLLGIVLVIVLARQWAPRDPVPPAVATILVGPDPEAAEGIGATPEAGEAVEPVSDPLAEPKTAEPDLPEMRPQPLDLQPPVLDREEPAGYRSPRLDPGAAPDAQQRIQDAKKRLRDRIKSGVPGKAGGSGGTSSKGRGERLVRWMLRIESRGIRGEAIRDYLVQIEGLGGVIAFPAKGDQWLYVYHASDPAQRSTREKDLSDENRIYWTNEKRETVIDVCNYLGIARADLMVMFLPTELEERMARLECEYQNKTEDEIAQTIFLVVREGGKYGVRVIAQTLK